MSCLGIISSEYDSPNEALTNLISLLRNKQDETQTMLAAYNSLFDVIKKNIISSLIINF